ncbi:AsnC family transcriptional regulator [Streptomyces sp. NPDC012935]|uniref:AsnC family transcriptional regulator n=1 Tax=Streptomyces sp. NPDC012935 TaxID=3364857 RepID=UPI0036C06084
MGRSPPVHGRRPAACRPVGELSRADRLLVNALAGDGRCTCDELARVSGVSEATARRRLGARTPTAGPDRVPGRDGPP